MKPIAINRQARFAYYIIETYEAGLVLTGTEVKSLRTGRASLKESFARIQDGEAELVGCHIPPYAQGNIHNHDPYRVRRLLLHRRELNELETKSRERGHTLIPLSIYFKRGHAKVEIAIAKGKSRFDKREGMKAKDAKREVDRVLAGRDRR